MPKCLHRCLTDRLMPRSNSDNPLSGPISRRAFIRAVGGAAAAAAIAPQMAWLGACSSKSTSPDWDGLAKQLHGRLVRPGQPSFAAVATPQNLRYANIHPQGVAVCRDAADVSACVRWATAEGVPVAVRSGGHNYAGYCTGPGLV